MSQQLVETTDRPQVEPFRVTVPATSANLGPGFDCLGIALGLYNRFDCTPAQNFEITGVERTYAGPDNLFWRAFNATREVIIERGLPDPGQLQVKFDAEIPNGRGLGSSAALFVGGATAANHMAGNPLTPQELFEICATLEGHPDNVAPALFGGMTASFREGTDVYAYQLDLDRRFFFTALIPDFTVIPDQSRAVLPERLPIPDAVYSLSRAVVLSHAFGAGDAEVVSAALSDRIHEPYRGRLISDLAEIRARILGQGALGVTISGSGSTLLVVWDAAGEREVPEAKDLPLDGLTATWTAKDLPVHMGGPFVDPLGDL
ncbi:homoserine kinase [Boudabousia liubingyangii]|uniref:homoserine kinase n=1 Tax=Boudabousia liubingyangii TaxID=1921764 RepID=UPI00093C69D7|nr:homoserine kinase [Boudabousia liubingyangii]OKL46803.1 homoserine kinase [Boudabousia liubingyangii]